MTSWQTQLKERPWLSPLSKCQGVKTYDMAKYINLTTNSGARSPKRNICTCLSNKNLHNLIELIRTTHQTHHDKNRIFQQPKYKFSQSEPEISITTDININTQLPKQRSKPTHQKHRNENITCKETGGSWGAWR